MFCRRLLFIMFLSISFNKVNLLENGVARTPPMGWMSWGYYMCADQCDAFPEKCLDEKLILSVADAFYKDGYQEAGYEYIIIDDCWSERQRDENGRLVPDHVRFPKGMKYIADYIHSRGLKFGMYMNIAEVTCMHYPGSKDHFKLDVESFKEWEIDYLKVDGCFVAESYLDKAYIELGQYLNETRRPIVYSCSWPYYKVFIHKHTVDLGKIQKYCNIWRNYHDVVTSWNSVKSIIMYFERKYNELEQYHGPGHWNDPDMLIFGTNSLTDSQSRVQIAVYSMLSAPLLLSCDMKMVNEFEKQLLLNLDLIAIAQDPLGIMAKPYRINSKTTIWVKRHLPMKGDKYHSVSFAIVNLERESDTVSFVPGDYGLDSKDGYSVMDVFTGTYQRNVTLKDSIHVTVNSEDTSRTLHQSPVDSTIGLPSQLAAKELKHHYHTRLIT